MTLFEKIEFSTHEWLDYEVWKNFMCSLCLSHFVFFKLSVRIHTDYIWIHICYSNRKHEDNSMFFIFFSFLISYFLFLFPYSFLPLCLFLFFFCCIILMLFLFQLYAHPQVAFSTAGSIFVCRRTSTLLCSCEFCEKTFPLFCSSLILSKIK